MTRADCTRLSFSLPGIDAAGKPPGEFRLFALGSMSTTKGEFLVDELCVQLCMEAFKDYGNRLTIDYEHQALSEPPVQAPAAASFVPELRADGIWATDVHWTPKAAEYLTNKEYLYFSPAFLTDEQNRPVRILNVALTNLPATKNMQPLVAASQKDTSMKTVLSALSLKDNASEAEALSAVAKLSDERKQLLAATGKDSVGEALGAIAGWKTSAAEVVELKAAAQKVAEEQAARDFDAEVDGARKAGLLAASDDHKRNKQALSYKGQPNALASLRGFLGALDPLVPTSAAPKASGEPPVSTGGVTALTAEEKRIADQFGLKHEAVLKNKARLALKASQPAQVDADDEDAA